MIKNALDSIIDQIVSNELVEIDGSRSHNSSNSNLSITNPFHTHNNSSANINDAQSVSGDYTNNPEFECKSVEEMDAFLIFRSLCKYEPIFFATILNNYFRLSEQNSDVYDPDSPQLQSVLLSLDMILLIVQNFNVQLPDKHSFVLLIRMFLCKALTKNSASRVRDVFEKALAIFVMLTNKFKVYLRAHIEVGY